MILHVSHLSKTYQTAAEELQVLQEISFSVRSGEWLTIIGPSGSGKSTLLHCISGMTKPDKGSSVKYDDWELLTAKEEEQQTFRRKHIGFIYQDYRLFDQFTVLTNTMLPLVPYEAKDVLKEWATALLKQVGLGDRMHHVPSQLSGGEKQRAGIARALINQPAYLLCDEPTGNLDEKNRDRVIELLKELNNGGTNILIVTHDKEMMTHGHQTIELSYGKQLQRDGAKGNDPLYSG